MTREFKNYLEWEDYKAGLYALPSSNDSEREIVCSMRLLSRPLMFASVALRMIDEWRVSARVQLSNKSRNRQAWLGQASCCFAFGCPEHQVKAAWHRLTEWQQKRANEIADHVIATWEKGN